jgi:hypothetical protein
MEEELAKEFTKTSLLEGKKNASLPSVIVKNKTQNKQKIST